ncbi:MAG: ATP-binding cassette domain-containing protein [Oscillospiraceae bacterium]|jgi:oligopeptide transport system ATP-binding protein|nr:ATP-binding cassette domain-containing protein [Oscillospiraceae bacterium]
MPNDDVILEVKDLSVHFGSLKAVDKISFSVRRGEVFGIVGESGCGKTTTGRALIRLYEPTGGEVYLDGLRISAGPLEYTTAIKDAKKQLRELKNAPNAEQNAALIEQYNAVVTENQKNLKALNVNYDAIYKSEKSKELRAEFEGRDDKESLDELNYRLRIIKKTNPVTQMQMIFQDPIASLDPRMTVRDIIAEGLVIGGHIKRDEVDEKVYAVLESVGLVREHALRYPHEFSGGQRQRIGIARAIIMKPKIIIADEPVSALDVSIQAQVITILNNLRKTLGLTVIFIAHDISVVKYISDRIAVMYYGKIVEEADSDELFAHPFHPYTHSLFSAIPYPDPLREKKRTRTTYNPVTAHDYSVNQPSVREVSPRHFVHCNDEEFAAYTAALRAGL